ncbi:hypothetical protein ACC733_37715, partial [Rhizobium johnstonii]
MRKSLQFILVGLAAMTGLTISPTIASAQDMELRIGPGGVGFYERYRYERYDRRGPRGCDPDDALDMRVLFRKAGGVDADASNSHVR